MIAAQNWLTSLLLTHKKLHPPTQTLKITCQAKVKNLKESKDQNWNTFGTQWVMLESFSFCSFSFRVKVWSLFGGKALPSWEHKWQSTNLALNYVFLWKSLQDKGFIRKKSLGLIHWWLTKSHFGGKLAICEWHPLECGGMSGLHTITPAFWANFCQAVLSLEIK